MTRRKTRRRFGRYVAIGDGMDTSAVYDRNADRAVVTELPPREAEALARDWNRHEKCSCPTCVPSVLAAAAWTAGLFWIGVL